MEMKNVLHCLASPEYEMGWLLTNMARTLLVQQVP